MATPAVWVLVSPLQLAEGGAVPGGPSVGVAMGTTMVVVQSHGSHVGGITTGGQVTGVGVGMVAFGQISLIGLSQPSVTLKKKGAT